MGTDSVGTRTILDNGRLVMSGDEYWSLDTYSRSSPCFILLHYDRTHGISVRDEYQKLMCPKCGRIDELKALRRGVSTSVQLPKNAPDIFTSDDWLHVVSTRAKDTLDGVRGVKMKCFPIPDSDHWVLWPSKLFYAPGKSDFRPAGGIPVDSPAIKIRKPPCKTCGRLREVTWTSDDFIVPSPITLAGVYLDRARVVSIGVVISATVKQTLESAKITGWRARRIGEGRKQPTQNSSQTKSRSKKKKK